MTNKKIVESTTAGAVASVAMPLGSTQKRAGSLFKGKKTKKKFYETRTFNSKQELIQYFLSRGKTAAEASAAWERGYRGTTKKKKKSSQPSKEHWLDRHEREKEEREESNKPPVKEQRKNKVYEGKMKNLVHDLQNLSSEEFIKEHKRTKEYFITLLGNPSKNTKVDNVSEAEIVETDLIITPGMIRSKDRGFIPHDKKRQDHEVEMARSDVYSAAKDATRIYRLIKDRTEDEGLMGWQQSYITLASDYLNSVADSLEHNTKTNEMTGGVLAGGMSNFEEGVAEGVTEAVWDRPSKSYVPRDGKTFGQTNHPREEHCDACGAATGHAGPGEDSNVDDNGNVYCDDCYSDKQSLGEGSDRDMETEIKAEIRKSEKMKNATRLYYYKWLLSTPNLHAATSYEIFINSWAGQQWFSKHKQKIESFAEEQNRRFLQNYKVDYPKQGMAETEITNFEESGDAKPRVNVQHLLDKMLQLQNKAMMAIDRERWTELEQVKNEMEQIENKVRSSGPGGDKTMDEFFQRLGSKEPIDVLEPKMYKKSSDDLLQDNVYENISTQESSKKTSVEENRWRNRLYGLKWNPLDRERREQGARDSEARSERNREINAGLEDEDNMPRRASTFTYYVRINGKILKNKQGELFKFNSTAAANKAINTMKSRPWNKDKTFTITQNPNDDTSNVSESGHQDDQKEREENLRYTRSRANVADQVRKTVDPNKKEEKCPKCGGEMVSEELINEKKDACYYKVKSRYKVWPSAYASGALVKCRKKGASNWGKSSKKKTNEDTATEPRKFTKPPGTTIKWSMGLEALLDEYVLLQAQRSAALYRNRHDLAMKHMEKMDELEELILKKPNGQKELAKVKTWMHKKDPEDTSVDDPEKPSDKAVNFQKMVDLRRQGKSYPTIAAELSAMTGKTFKPNSVKSYIGSRPDFADIQQDFAKARGVLP